VLEVEIAQKAGLGWRGKHTLLLSREEGSFFFLGEIFTDWPLPVNTLYDRTLRVLSALYSGVSYTGDCGTLSIGCKAMYCLSGPLSLKVQFLLSFVP